MKTAVVATEKQAYYYVVVVVFWLFKTFKIFRGFGLVHMLKLL